MSEHRQKQEHCANQNYGQKSHTLATRNNHHVSHLLAVASCLSSYLLDKNQEAHGLPWWRSG